MTRRLLALWIVLGMLTIYTPTATAGGWATIAFDTLPSEVTTGEATTLEFRVLAHNNPDTPVPDMETSFLFINTETGYFAIAEGTATDTPDVYAITFTLTEPGEWEIRAMIHNYLDDGPILWTSPNSVMAIAPHQEDNES